MTIAARYPEHKPAPVSGIPTQEIYTLFGSAVASATGTRRLVGVAAQGMTACPCAQETRQERSRERCDDGFSDDEIGGSSKHVPVATHNQRGLGTLHVGMPEDCDTEIDARDAARHRRGLDVSEIYELMKRSDEGAVVEKAHRRPRFVEDCVREMIGGVVEALPDLSDDTSSRPARRTSRRSTSTTSSPSASGCSASCAHELATGEHAPHHVTMREWLDGAAALTRRPLRAQQLRSPKK